MGLTWHRSGLCARPSASLWHGLPSVCVALLMRSATIRDLLMDIILEVVTGREQNHKYAALCPKLLCDWAGWVCPF